MSKIKVPICVSVTYSGNFIVEVDESYDDVALTTAAREQVPFPCDTDEEKKNWNEDEMCAIFAPNFTILPGFKLNPNSKVVEKITSLITRNNGECICHNESRDKHCPCSDYLEKGKCQCGLYIKE